MSAADSFTLFRALPLELRLQILGEALPVRSVWVAVRNRALDCDPTGMNHPSLRMAYIGPAPYLAGLSSQEARKLLEEPTLSPVVGQALVFIGLIWTKRLVILATVLMQWQSWTAFMLMIYPG